jgi:hypothetical protein
MCVARKYRFLFLICFVFILLPFYKANAQDKDTAIYAVKSDTAKGDTIPKKKHQKMSKPDQAALMSAIIPGLGQIGHKDAWWHVPIIYAGFGVIGYFIYDNNNSYQQFRSYYQTRLRTDANPKDSAYDPYNPLNKHAIGYIYYASDLLSYREVYRRNRDLSIILAVAWYGANILDAYVSAHLREFDITNNLSMQVQPLNFSLLANQPVVSCGLKFNLK